MDADSEKDLRETAELEHVERESEWLRAHAGAARSLASSLPDEFDIARAGLESLAGDMDQEAALRTRSEYQENTEVTPGVKMCISANKTRKQAFAEVFPPGQFVTDELEARGWSHADLAKAGGLSTDDISNIISGACQVTPEIARVLAKAFGTDAQTWLNLESAYQAWASAR